MPAAPTYEPAACSGESCSDAPCPVEWCQQGESQAAGEECHAHHSRRSRRREPQRAGRVWRTGRCRSAAARSGSDCCTAAASHDGSFEGRARLVGDVGCGVAVGVGGYVKESHWAHNLTELGLAKVRLLVELAPRRGRDDEAPVATLVVARPGAADGETQSRDMARQTACWSRGVEAARLRDPCTKDHQEQAQPPEGAHSFRRESERRRFDTDAAARHRTVARSPMAPSPAALLLLTRRPLSPRVEPLRHVTRKVVGACHHRRPHGPCPPRTLP